MLLWVKINNIHQIPVNGVTSLAGLAQSQKNVQTTCTCRNIRQAQGSATMQINIFPRWSMTEAVWKTVILSLIISLLVLTVFCLSRGINTVFMHLYYFPIVLMAYHYHRKGILYTGVFCLIYLALVYSFTYPNQIEEEAGIIRAVVFLCIAAVVALLSETLEKQKAGYVALFESAEEALMKVDLASLSVVEVNPRLCEMLGCKPSEVKGSHLDRLWPDDNARRDFIQQLSLKKAVRSHESIIAQDGSMHDVIVSAGLLPGNNAIFTLTDVSEQKRAEKRMQALMQLHESIIMNANVWLMVLDPMGKVLIWNKAAEDISGYRSNEVVGTTTVWKWIYPDREYRKKITGNIVNIVQTNNFFENLETTIRCKDGQERVISWNTRGLIDKGGAAIQESEDKYRRFFSTSRDSVFITSEDGRWVDLNDAAVELFGYAGRDELMRVKIGDLYADPDKRNEHIRIILETGFSKEYPVALLKKDGTIMHTLVTTVARKDEAGNVIGFQGTVRDITELKRAEEALIFAGKKLNLLNSITRHDINNQLMALDVFIHLSNDMTNDPAMRELLDKEANISAIIARQIAFTKDYQELGVKAPGWQNVHATILKAAAALPMRNVRIAVDCTDLEVFADPLFEKVFYNLIDNALRYGGDRMTTIRVSSHDAEVGLVIVFEDDGAGISTDDKMHLFERGFGKNTGLGLFLVREILSITRLSITETGEPGKGARFEISVPKGAFRFHRENGSDAGGGI
jgi:PAS domain S-box-containing protein